MYRHVLNPVIVRGVFPRGTPHDYMLHATQFEGKEFWARRPFLKVECHLAFCFVRKGDSRQKAHLSTVSNAQSDGKRALELLVDSLTVSPDSGPLPFERLSKRIDGDVALSMLLCRDILSCCR